MLGETEWGAVGKVNEKRELGIGVEGDAYAATDIAEG